MARLWLDTVRGGPHGGVGDLVLAGRQDGGRGIRSGGRARRYPVYAIALITAGTGRYRDATRDVPIGPGTVAYVFPGMPHWFGVTDPRSTWDEVYLAFTGPIFDVAAHQGLLDRDHPLRRLRDVDHWYRRIERFRTRTPPTTRPERDAEACEVLQLLADISSATAFGEPRENTDDWFQHSCRILATDPGERLALHAVALSVGLRYETWRRRFKARSGYSPGRFRLNRRIDTAIELSRYSTMRSTDIAAETGFTDVQHLARHIKSATGYTPRQLRDHAERTV